MGAISDGELVQLAQSGVREAFGELVRRHRSKMYGYARSITHGSAWHEDIVQEALIRAFLHLRKLVDIQRFLPRVHRIVRQPSFHQAEKQLCCQRTDVFRPRVRYAQECRRRYG